MYAILHLKITSKGVRKPKMIAMIRVGKARNNIGKMNRLLKSAKDLRSGSSFLLTTVRPDIAIAGVALMRNSGAMIQ